MKKRRVRRVIALLRLLLLYNTSKNDYTGNAGCNLAWPVLFLINTVFYLGQAEHVEAQLISFVSFPHARFYALQQQGTTGLTQGVTKLLSVSSINNLCISITGHF